MAICKFCKQEMLDHTSCHPRIMIGGQKYNRKKYKGEVGEYCTDCGCGINEYHHFECDMERCPICGEQLCIHSRCKDGSRIEAIVNKYNKPVIWFSYKKRRLA